MEETLIGPWEQPLGVYSEVLWGSEQGVLDMLPEEDACKDSKDERSRMKQLNNNRKTTFDCLRKRFPMTGIIKLPILGGSNNANRLRF